MVEWGSATWKPPQLGDKMYGQPLIITHPYFIPNNNLKHTHAQRTHSSKKIGNFVFWICFEGFLSGGDKGRSWGQNRLCHHHDTLSISRVPSNQHTYIIQFEFLDLNANQNMYLILLGMDALKLFWDTLKNLKVVLGHHNLGAFPFLEKKRGILILDTLLGKIFWSGIGTSSKSKVKHSCQDLLGLLAPLSTLYWDKKDNLPLSLGIVIALVSFFQKLILESQVFINPIPGTI